MKYCMLALVSLSKRTPHSLLFSDVSQFMLTHFTVTIKCPYDNARNSTLLTLKITLLLLFYLTELL